MYYFVLSNLCLEAAALSSEYVVKEMCQNEISRSSKKMTKVTNTFLK